MANTLKLVEMGKISQNPLNERSMDPSEIDVIKDSIMEVGLLHPLVVYEESEDHFILVSGHKRFKALQELGRMPNSTVQCTVVDKPSDITQEQELLARGNVGRSNPEQIANEIKLVNNIWNTMDSSRRKRLTESYRATFEIAHKDDPAYISDKTKYMTNRFRARMEYINHITGLNMSNKTISQYLKTTLENEDEALIDDKPKKERAFTIKQIAKSIDSLQGLIEGYSTTHDDTPVSLLELQTELEKTADDLKSSDN